MASSSSRHLLAGVVAAVVAIVFVIVRRLYDLPAVVEWGVLAFLTWLLIWRLRQRSPYSDRRDDLRLRPK
jgi:hypothetical protein